MALAPHKVEPLGIVRRNRPFHRPDPPVGLVPLGLGCDECQKIARPADRESVMQVIDIKQVMIRCDEVSRGSIDLIAHSRNAMSSGSSG